ncbi:hypothetical protein GMLC_14770 [Geomonas limicola]|uniref:Uncharacterized protein n=1 Tax=Geomonas limicola TaxID=2740186 RepID=A0A6V8N5R2_9BACT|nr:hypothetical protein GMLC_14770 [Geomonas limicola]
MTSATITAILSLLAYLLPLIVEGVKGWQGQQKGADHEKNIQDYREALGKGDSAALSARHADQHDRVLAALRGR